MAAKFQSFSHRASTVTILVGCLVILGWLLDIQILKTGFPGLASMKLNTALCFILAGVALRLVPQQIDPRPIAWNSLLSKLCAGATVFIGALSLIQYSAGQDFGIDQLLVREAITSDTLYPGRMAPVTAFNFIIFGGVLLLLNGHVRWGHRSAQLLTLIPILLSGLGLIGYIYNVTSLYKVSGYTSMAAHTATTFIILGCAVLSTYPNRGVMPLLTGDHVGGYLTRRLLPVAIALPIALGWLTLKGQQSGLYDSQFGLSLFVSLYLVVSVVIIWTIAKSLEQSDAERRQATAEMRESESRFRSLADSAPVLIWMSDTDKLCTYFNQPWLTFVGRSMEQELGHGWTENVHPEDFAHCLKRYEQAFDARNAFTMEYRLQRRDGEWRWLLDHGVPRYETDDTFVGYIGSCIDITGIKVAESAVRESEERLSGIIGSAMDAIITINDQYRVTDFNGAAEQMFGCEEAEAIGQSIDRFIPARFRASHASHIDAFGKTAVSQRQMGKLGTIYGLRANGEEFPIEAAISQLSIQGRKFYTVILRDVTQRRQAEEVLRASERRFRDLIESIPQLVWTCRPDGPCDYLSPQWIAYTGIPEDRQLGSGWLEQVHPDDRDHLMTRWRATIEESRMFEVEFRLRRADGMYRWFQTRAIPLRDDRGTVTKWYGTNTDVHDRKESEEVQARLGAIVESSDDAIVSESPEGLVQTWNEGARRMFGYRAEDIIGKPMLTLIPPERYLEETEIMKNVQSGKSAQHFETVRQRKDGSCVDVSLAVSSVRNPTGSIIAVSKIARDISARKLAEERLRLVVEGAPNGIIVINGSHCIELVNSAVEHQFGYTRDELLGQPFELLVPPRLRDQQKANLTRLLRESTFGTDGANRDFFALHKNGTEFPIEIGLTPLQTPDGKHLLASIVDITERKQAEAVIHELSQTLMRTQEIERRTIARELHDQVGQLLTTVKLHLSIVQTRLNDPTLSDNIGESINLVDRALEETRQLSLQLRPEALDELGLIPAIRWYLDRQSQLAGLICHLSVEGLNDRLQSQDVESACFRLVQEAITNVIRHANACRVHIIIRGSDANLEIAISDDGQGFDPEITNKQRPVSKRLGLLGMRERIDQLNGHLAIHSAPGAGTTVVFKLPLTE